MSMSNIQILRAIARDGRCLDDVCGTPHTSGCISTPTGMIFKWDNSTGEGWAFCPTGERLKYSTIMVEYQDEPDPDFCPGCGCFAPATWGYCPHCDAKRDPSA